MTFNRHVLKANYLGYQSSVIVYKGKFDVVVVVIVIVVSNETKFDTSCFNSDSS